MGVEVCDDLDGGTLLLRLQHLGTKCTYAFSACVVISVLNRNISTSKLLQFDFWEYSNNPARFLNSRMPSVLDLQSVPSTTTPIASRLFKIFRNSGDRKMGRTCRLICRDWASECAVPEPKGWRVEDGVVWHWVETKWRVLPTWLWAWTPGPFADEWWVEQRCHQRWSIKVVPLGCSIASSTNEFAFAFEAPPPCRFRVARPESELSIEPIITSTDVPCIQTFQVPYSDDPPA